MMDEMEFKNYANDFISRLIEENYDLDKLEGDFKAGYNQLSDKQRDNLYFLMFVARDHIEILREADTEKSIHLLSIMKDAWHAGKNSMFWELENKSINLGDILHNSEMLSKFKNSIELISHINDVEKKVKDLNPDITNEELGKITLEYYEKIKSKFGFKGKELNAKG